MQNTTGIQVSGVFHLAKRRYGGCPLKNASLYLFDKLENG